MTQFYIERYLDLRNKSSSAVDRNRDRSGKQHQLAKTMVYDKHRSMVHMSERRMDGGQKRGKSRFKDREETAKKSGKSKHHKLLIEGMIDDVDCG
jgi:hypothetical protein